VEMCFGGCGSCVTMGLTEQRTASSMTLLDRAALLKCGTSGRYKLGAVVEGVNPPTFPDSCQSKAPGNCGNGGTCRDMATDSMDQCDKVLRKLFVV